MILIICNQTTVMITHNWFLSWLSNKHRRKGDAIFSLTQEYSIILLVICRLQGYDAETAIAIIIDGSVSLKIDTQHLRDINFRIGSIYQFIGELLVQSDNNVSCWCSHHPWDSISPLLLPRSLLDNALVSLQPHQALLQARVGRNVDGIDLNLYHQSLQLRRQFEAEHLNSRTI